MDIEGFVAIGVLLAVVFCSFMVGRKVYMLIKNKSNGWAIAAGIVSSLAFFSLAAIAILAIFLYNTEFER